MRGTGDVVRGTGRVDTVEPLCTEAVDGGGAIGETGQWGKRRGGVDVRRAKGRIA